MKRMLYCLVLAGSILCAVNPTIATTAAIDEQGKPPRPAWVGSKAGASEGLLPGWEPVGVEDNIVRPWGRGYRFEGLPAPVEVTSAGASLLTGPIRFVAVVAGQEVSWTPRKTEIQKINDVVVRVMTEADSDKVQLKGSVTVEFDGVIRSDWQIIPNGKVTLERLALEIPVKREHARYLYTFPGGWGNASNAGAAPTGPLDTVFRPFIWLGDESRGFGWFSESDRNFFVGDARKVTQIVPGDRETLLRIDLVTQSIDLDKPLDYTFGFQATPVRDNPQDAWDFRICHHGGYGIQDAPYNPPASISYPAQGNFNLDQGTLEAWLKVNFDPGVEIKDSASRGTYNREFFALNLPSSDSTIGFYWNIDDRGMRVYLKQEDQFPLLVGSKCGWQKGEWHHIALTWGDSVAVWNDGKKVAESPWKGTLGASLENAQMIFKCLTEHFDIDEIRISDVPRQAFDLTKPPEADEHTLLLDHLDGVPGSLEHTLPAKGVPGRITGAISKPGKFGESLGSSTDNRPTTLLSRLAELGVRTICFHEHWTDIQNYTSTSHGAELHDLVRACHEKGIRLVLYFGYLMSDIAPEWPQYSDECLVYPRTGEYHRMPEQHAYSVCYRSVWQDFLADGIARIMDEYDIDGVYLDGTEYPWPCRNVKHGCGYMRPDGTLGETYTFFSTRDLMKRIWMIVKSRKPDGIVNVHSSTCMTTPTLAFATSYWDGEQLGGIPRGRRALDVLPLETFRCEFMGHQWGIPAELLCYGQPYTYSEAMSFSLLHDVLVRGSLNGGLECESKLWKAMDEFGRHQAKWLPYWNNRDAVTTDSDNTKVSLYSRGGKGVVAVMSNLAGDPRDVQVRLNLQNLQLSGELSVWDVISEHDVSLSAEGLIEQKLNPLDFRVIWVKPITPAGGQGKE
jgi:hypothetical protein